MKARMGKKTLEWGRRDENQKKETLKESKCELKKKQTESGVEALRRWELDWVWGKRETLGQWPTKTLGKGAKETLEEGLEENLEKDVEYSLGKNAQDESKEDSRSIIDTRKFYH